MKYRLGDITVKDWNDWDRVPRDPTTIGFRILGSLGIMASSTAAFVVGYIATTLVTSWALRALAPKPDFGAGSRGLLVNAREATAPQQIVYGEIRKGGTVTFIESTGNTNQYLHQIIVLAGHEVNSIGDIYINENQYEVNGSGWVTDQRYDEETEAYVTDNKWGYDSGTSTSKIRIKKHLGADNQTADSDLVSETSVTSDFKGEGIAYLYVRMEYDQNVFAEGVPLFTAKVQGKKVYDPRTSTTAYSANAALCIRDYLVSAYGLDNSGDVNDAYFQTAANTCDESVTLAGSGTESRYEINGVISLDQTPSDILGDMMTACAGTLFWGQGEWHLKVGEYTSSIKTFTLDDLRGPINLDTKHSRRDNFNIVRGTFVDADQGYIRADYPEIRSSSFITDDNGIENALDLALPLTTSASMAQRLAKMTLFRAREQMTFTADFGLEAFEVECGDIIALTIDRYGWSAKEFEVVGWKFRNDGDAGDLRVGLTLRETSAAAFSWSAEETAITANNSTLPDPRSGLTVQNLSASQQSAVTTDGTFTLFARLSWDAVDSAYVDHYEVQWRKTADTDYQSTTTDANSLDTGFLIDDVEYTFRVRAVTGAGYRGEFAQTTLTTAPDTTAPSVPVMSSATGGYNQIKVSWENPSDDDFKEVIVFRNASNNSSTSTEVARISSDAYIDAGLSDATTFYYWVKSVDYSGNVSGFSLAASATTNTAPADGEDGQNARGYVMTNQSHTVPAGRSGVVDSYSGSGTDIEVYDGLSRLTYTTGTLSSGYFKVTGTVVSPSGSITVGAFSFITGGVRVADHSSMDVAEDVVTITYNISGMTYSGTAFSFGVTQTITKSSAGADGAGRWNIPVTSLPTTSAQAQTAWDASSVGRDEVESDQAWFYTGTEANPTGQSVWIYDSGTSTWNEQNEVIDGSLLVTGTVTSDAVETNFIDAFDIDATNITTGTLNADRINIDNVTMDTDSSGRLIVKALGVDSDQIALNAASQLRFDKDTSAYTIPSYPSFDWSARVTFTHDPNTVQILARFSARANLSVTGGHGFASVYLVRKENGTVVESQQLQNVAVGTQSSSRAAANYVQSYISRQEVYTPPSTGVTTEIEIRFTSLQTSAVNPDFFLDESYLEVVEIKR